MVQSLSLILLLLAAASAAAPAAAQWAVSSQVNSRNLSLSYFNGSGITFFANGVVDYAGPLNTVDQGQVPPTLSLVLNGETFASGIVSEVADALPTSTAYPRLSPQLEEASVAVGENSLLKVGLGEALPLYVKVGASRVQLTQESVDGQSFSVYPSFQPSLQLPREGGLYSDPTNPDNPNAENAGPTRLDDAVNSF